MTKNKRGDLMVPPKGGMFRDLVMRLKLIGRLMLDRRVNLFIKILPLFSLAYLFWPLDLASGMVLPIIGAVDDAAILWFSNYLFIELCPPGVVNEHMQELTSNMDMVESHDEIVDAESVEVTDEQDQ
ncbi:MAG: hypothetical protein Kow002_09700 [Anaerolineales bacterium]